MKSSLIYCCFLILFSECVKQTDTKSAHLKQIVIINISHLNQNNVANLLRTIGKCKPRVVALNMRFDAGSSELDSLGVAIKMAKNVVLPLLDSTGVLLPSAYQEVAVAVGIHSFGGRSNIADAVQLAVVIDERVYWSYPLAICGQYSVDVVDELFDQITPDVGYELETKYSLEDFVHYEDGKKMNCDSIENKIVIFGYLDPSEEQFLVNRNGKIEEMYQSVVLANSIVQLLDTKKLIRK